MCYNKDFNNYYVNDLYIRIITMTLFIFMVLINISLEIILHNSAYI